MTATAAAKCARCRRPLTAEQSLNRHLGPVCYGKSALDLAKESNGTDAFDLAWDAATGDVVCRRDEVTGLLHFNIGLLDNTVKQGGFEWGYEGTGPAMFALNILLWFGVPLAEAQRGGNYQNFKREFVARLPKEGGTIPGPAIRAWIAENCLTPAQFAARQAEIDHADYDARYTSVVG